MNTQIPFLLTRLLYESDDALATLADIKRVVEILEKALAEIGEIPEV